MRTAAWLGNVLECGPAVAESAVMNELKLPGFKIEVGRQRVVVEDFEHRGKGGGPLLLDRRFREGVAAADLVRAEAGPQLAGPLEDRRREDRVLAGMKLALPVEAERPVKSRQQLRPARQHLIVDGVKARN